MDGNGRWAKARHLPRIEGHRQGAKSVREVVEESRRLGIRYLTLFSFSSENWRRPRDEISALMKLFCQHLESEADNLCQHGVRLRTIGEIERLPREVQELLGRVVERSAAYTELQLVLAMSYGARDELVHAMRAIAHKVQLGEVGPEDICSDLVQRHLYAPDIPDPDLLIRTSGEQRLSNFLLWQLAYTEIVTTPVLWPDFRRDEYHSCLGEFALRERRYGMTSEQRK